MPEAISDTGPILHLSEIGRLHTLPTVSPLLLPDLVVSELASRGLNPQRLEANGIQIETSSLHLSRAFRSYIRQLLVEIH